MLKVVASEPACTKLEVDSAEELEDVLRRLHDSGVPDEDIHVAKGSYPTAEVTDDDMAWSVRRGVLIGVPGVYLAVVAMALLAGVSIGEAAMLGIIPAAFCGWFVAGFVFLNARTGAVETGGHTVALHEVDVVVVTGEHAALALAVRAPAAA